MKLAEYGRDDSLPVFCKLHTGYRMYLLKKEIKMPTRHRRRNPVAMATILRKGGVHEKSRKAKRQKQKRDLRKMISKAMTTDGGHFFCLFIIESGWFRTGFLGYQCYEERQQHCLQH